MNKKRKILLSLAGLLTFIPLASCGENSSSVKPSNNETSKETTSVDTSAKDYVMEAEYINLDGVVGAGLSSDQAGVEMIYGDGTQAQKDMGWGEGFYVGYTYSNAVKLDFVFTSDKAGTGTFALRLGSELGDINITPEAMEVKLNDVALSYTSIFVEGSSMDKMKFFDKTVSTNGTIKNGSNTLSVLIHDNDLRPGNQTGGPTIDSLKIQTSSVLSWTDKKDNPSRRGEI